MNSNTKSENGSTGDPIEPFSDYLPLSSHILIKLRTNKQLENLMLECPRNNQLDPCMKKSDKDRENKIRTAIARVDYGDAIRVVRRSEPRKVIFGESHSRNEAGNSLRFAICPRWNIIVINLDDVKSVRILSIEELLKLAWSAHEEKKEK